MQFRTLAFAAESETLFQKTTIDSQPVMRLVLLGKLPVLALASELPPARCHFPKLPNASRS